MFGRKEKGEGAPPSFFQKESAQLCCYEDQGEGGKEKTTLRRRNIIAKKGEEKGCRAQIPLEQAGREKYIQPKKNRGERREKKKKEEKRANASS